MALVVARGPFRVATKKGSIMKPSSKDEVAGKIHEVKGAVKEKVGKLANNPDLEADGKVEKIISVGFHPIASESGLTVSGRCHIGFVCHSDKPYCNGRATKLPMNVNC